MSNENFRPTRGVSHDPSFAMLFTVPFDNLRKSLPKNIQIDTQTWGLRRFALVRIVDALSQDMYVALHEGDLTPRDAQNLLDHLGEAAFYLYQPGSMLRRLMSPTGGRREFNTYKKPLTVNRRLRGRDKGSRRLRHIVTPTSQMTRFVSPSVPRATRNRERAAKPP